MSKNQPDSNTLRDYINTAWGYGDWNRKIWFLGMEEGGCTNLVDFDKRLTAWKNLGGNALVDCKVYHTELSKLYDDGTPAKMALYRLFNERVKIQSSWNKIIRFYLALSSSGELPATREMVRAFQRNRLNELCLIELLPLPARSTRPHDWFYDELECINDIQTLKTRESYTEEILKKRIMSLIAKAQEFKPQLIVAYGKRYQAAWKDQLEKWQPIECGIPNSFTAWIGNTQFILVPHPRGVPRSNPWHTAGMHFRQQQTSPTT